MYKEALVPYRDFRPDWLLRPLPEKKVAGGSSSRQPFSLLTCPVLYRNRLFLATAAKTAYGASGSQPTFSSFTSFLFPSLPHSFTFSPRLILNHLSHTRYFLWPSTRRKG